MLGFVVGKCSLFTETVLASRSWKTLGSMLQTLAGSLILGFSSVQIISQNYRFSSVQNSLSQI